MSDFPWQKSSFCHGVWGRSLLAPGNLKSLSFSYRHPGAGRDPVASVIDFREYIQLCRDNSAMTPLGSGLRRNDE